MNRLLLCQREIKNCSKTTRDELEKIATKYDIDLDYIIDLLIEYLKMPDSNKK